MDVRKLQMLVAVTLSAMYDTDPTGEEGCPEVGIYMAVQDHLDESRDWSTLLLALTTNAPGKAVLVKVKAHTLYLTPRGVEVGKSVSSILDEEKKARDEKVRRMSEPITDEEI
jgi:hypothetical protein